jgi:type IV pilus assembly protein PilV
MNDPINYRNQQGVGLIEVLVAVLVLGVGLLGLAGLQTQSLRFNNEAYFRTQATLLSMDMADRLRSNFEFARTNSGIYTFTKTETVPSGGTDCYSSACTPAEIAAYDFKQWRTRVEEVLPGGLVALTPEATGTAVPWQGYIIEVEFSSTESPTDQIFRYRVRI